MMESGRVGKRGTLVIPAAIRKRLGLEEGQQVLFSETADGLVIRPAVTMPVEIYSPQRRAELLLNNAMDPKDYLDIRQIVRDELGIDPDSIPHELPRGA